MHPPEAANPAQFAPAVLTGPLVLQETAVPEGLSATVTAAPPVGPALAAPAAMAPTVQVYSGLVPAASPAAMAANNPALLAVHCQAAVETALETVAIVQAAALNAVKYAWGMHCL